MIKSIAAVLFYLGLATAALAQAVVPPADTINCAFNTSPPTVASGSMVRVQCDSTGKLLTTSGGGGGGAVTVADGADVTQGTTTDAPAAIPTSATPATTIALLKALNNNSQVKQIAGVDGFSNAQVGVSPSQAAPATSLIPASLGYVFNGSSLDRLRSINTASPVGTGTQAVAIAPTSASTGGITSIVSTSAENNHVLKASPGNLYSVYATNLTATAGFLVILNATTSPADGAITPLECSPLPANGNASINYNPGPPSVFSTGITAVITSATTCFTKTTGVITGFIKGSVQ